jgi:hypothetical protein
MEELPLKGAGVLSGLLRTGAALIIVMNVLHSVSYFGAIKNMS